MLEAELDRYKYVSELFFSHQLKEVIETGWTRITSEVAADSESDFVWVHSLQDNDVLSEEWLSQANHVFNRLGILSNFENYVVLNEIEFRLTISQLMRDPPEGFLFLCPPEDFRIGDTLSFKWPDCPAYWSFDPSGTERLSMDEAVSFGFPTLGLSRLIRGNWWDANVYASLRRFHQAKGFDPDSQDVARHLGYPLFELSREFYGPFAHIGEEDSCDEDDAAAEDLESIFESSNNAQHNLPLEQDSQQSSLNEETSVSKTFKFARDFVTAFIPRVHDTESEGMGFSPVLM
ncbi:hypothetical protein K438DRAFT_1841074 [Mycena galopus ATCC 62051]|nr:hypothetical protein K438DRAFT_1841074 [Mycena galopus ATCC 62051]